MIRAGGLLLSRMKGKASGCPDAVKGASKQRSLGSHINRVTVISIRAFLDTFQSECYHQP